MRQVLLHARSTRRGRSPWLAIVTLAVLGGAGVIGARAAGWFEGEQPTRIEGAPVVRGPLRIAVVARGNLKAAESTALRCGLEGRTTILMLVPEGTWVEEGQLVCELDASALVERLLQQTISVNNAEAAFVKSRQNHEIQESQNRSDIAAAQQKLKFAEQDLRRFEEGDRASLRQKAQQAIDLAKEEEARAMTRLTWSNELAEKGFLTNSELESDRIAQHRAQVVLEQATLDLDLLERFELPRKQDQLSSAVEEARRELERVELQAKARLVDFAADLRSSEAELGLEREKRTKLEEQVAKAKLRAPRAGMIVYAQRDSDEPPIQEGAGVREREEILSIPSTAGMIAQAKLHESVVKQVELGLSCTLRSDALPSRQLAGKVTYLAVLPDQNSWWANPNTRLYRTDVAIDSDTTGLRPGMSCLVEILIEELPDTLHIPLQAVHSKGDESIVFVRSRNRTERRTVRTGRYNEQVVQVLEGLSEGEIVLLSAPAGTDLGPTGS